MADGAKFDRPTVTPALFSRQISSLTRIDPGEREFIYLFHLARPSFLSDRLRARSARPFIIAAREMRRRNSSRSGTRALSISLAPSSRSAIRLNDLAVPALTATARL